MNKLFVLWIVALISASAWGACQSANYSASFEQGQKWCAENSVSYSQVPSKSCAVFLQSSGGYYVGDGIAVCNGLTQQVQTSLCSSGYRCTNYGYLCRYNLWCSNRCSADSASAGGIILECQYDVVEGKWYKYTCTGGNSCADGVCRRDYYNDETLCLAKYCEDYPTAEGCEQEKDTTLFACSDFGNGKSGLFRLSCRALGNNIVSCNGKTDVNVETDGTLIRENDGTCAQNGFENGIFGGSSADTTQPQSQSADCIAQLGFKCVMRDRNSGNTYQCDCDGSCDYAMRQMAQGSGCVNPYPQPTSSPDINLSSWNESQSSASSSPSSGGSSEPAGSSSSGGGDASSSSDFEYDYTDVLNDIRANTQYTGNQLFQANNYLRDIAGKDWSPTINVAAPNVNVSVAGDTNIINVSGDTARSGAAIYDWLTANNYSIDTSGRVKWNNWADSIQGVVRGVLDSVGRDSVSDYADSIGGAVAGVRTSLNALRDSVTGGAFGDSLGRWQNLITNNGVITGAGSNSCPSVLTREYTWKFPMIGREVQVSVGSIGKYICTPIADALSVSVWTLIRILLRASVAITCMFWLYRVITGTDESDSGGEN